jgi:2',3'-cyclic-nucleotide 2'-phosphodiesterase (5'-nucleotidase family)
MAEAKFPIYAANLRGANGQPIDGFKDRSIVTYDGVRIGLTGATLDDTPRMSTPDDLIFLPTLAAMKYQAEQLRREGADFVVTVVHADRKQDLALGAMHPIDLVLTGHDHDLFVNFDRSLVVESSYDAHYVVLMDITIQVKTTDGRREVEWWPEIRIVDTATVTPDPDVATAVAKFSQDLDRELNVPLATTSIELDSRNPIVRGREAAIGSLFADAMRDAAKADVAITNGGGIRGGKIYEPGSTITRRDVLGELPFGNRLVVLEMRGRDLRRALENGFAQLPNQVGAFPQISGLTVRVDASRPVGQRVVSVQVGNAPLLPTKTYRVATNDFLAAGGDNYTMFSSLTPTVPVDDAPLLANAVMSYLRKLGTISAVSGNRIDIK